MGGPAHKDTHGEKICVAACETAEGGKAETVLPCCELIKIIFGSENELQS